MSPSEINKKLGAVGIELKSYQLEDGNEITDVSDPTNIEGLYKLVTVTLKNTKTGEISKRLIWDQPLKVVTVPIIIHNADVDYFLFVSQSRFAFGGKVSIEVNKGFISEEADVEDSLLWHYLVGRKVPYLAEFVDVTKIVNLGSYIQHPDLTTFRMPFQLVFAKSKENFDITELKHNLKIRHDYFNEPQSGPPLHNTEPVLKSLGEVRARLIEIRENAANGNSEFYINDTTSITAISLALEYLKINGSPFK